MFIVTYVDYGETCDGHARALGTYETRFAAQAAIDADVRGTKRVYGAKAVTHPNEVWASEKEIGTHGCVWDVHKVTDPQ